MHIANLRFRGFQTPVHARHQSLAQLVLFQQAPELQQRRRIRRTLAAQINPRKATKHRTVIQRILAGLIGQINQCCRKLIRNMRSSPIDRRLLPQRLPNFWKTLCGALRKYVSICESQKYSHMVFACASLKRASRASRITYGGEVELGLTDANNGCLLTSPAAPSAKYVVMPTRL